METGRTLLVLLVFIPAVSALTSAGCEDGWSVHASHCYVFRTEALDAAAARVECELLNASLSSTWSSSETYFLFHDLWPRHLSRGEKTWLGLYGNGDNKWAWRDESPVTLDTYDAPSIKYNKCGALKGDGTLSYLDCSDMVPAYVCKKALPKLYASSALVNHTVAGSAPASAPRHLLFERVWPPLLASLPSSLSPLSSTSTATETSCAYRCFNVVGCQAFRATCVTSSACGLYVCVLFSQV